MDFSKEFKEEVSFINNHRVLCFNGCSMIITVNFSDPSILTVKSKKDDKVFTLKNLVDSHDVNRLHTEIKTVFEQINVAYQSTAVNTVINRLWGILFDKQPISKITHHEVIFDSSLGLSGYDLGQAILYRTQDDKVYLLSLSGASELLQDLNAEGDLHSLATKALQFYNDGYVTSNRLIKDLSNWLN